jgi:excinuclease ABC subunit A
MVSIRDEKEPSGSRKSKSLILEYYEQQGIITDPCEYKHLLDDIPREISRLVKTVQGLLVSLPWREAYGLEISQDRQKEIYIRTVPDMLKQILELDSSPLTVERPPQKRKVSLCRDFAVLLVSMLRYQHVPARARVGFAGYYRAETPRYWDHRIAEYWNERLNCWMLVDAMTDKTQLERLRFQIDPLNIDRSSQFLLAGDVWQRCGAGKANPKEFGDSPDDLGMPPIRYALLHDFDYLNKNELVGFDAWHDLISKPENELTEEERELLDELAELTNHVDTHFNALRKLYCTTPYGQSVQLKLSSL